MRKLFLVLLVGFMVWKGHAQYAGGDAAPVQAAEAATTAAAQPLPAAALAPASSYTCDGRQHCSQMRSCEEAKYFLAHCPGVKMDGDHDGIPCEQQLCTGMSD